MAKNNYPTKEKWIVSSNDDYEYGETVFDDKKKAVAEYEDSKECFVGSYGNPEVEDEESFTETPSDGMLCVWSPYDDENYFLKLSHVPPFQNREEELIWMILHQCDITDQGMEDYMGARHSFPEMVTDPVEKIRTYVVELREKLRTK